MSKFYCNKCNKDVILKNGICPYCKTNWDKLIEESINSEPIKDEKNIKELMNDSVADNDFWKDKEVTEFDIEDNIKFFLRWAFICRVVIIIYAFIVFIYSLIGISNDTPNSFALLLSVPFIIIISSIVYNNLKWKAYMLYTNKEKNKK